MTYAQRCQYCGAEVILTEETTLVKCVACGNTLNVSKLYGEIDKMRRLTEKNGRIEKALQEAHAEKERLQAQLSYALTELGGIRGTQEAQEARLEKILYEMGDERSDMQALIEGIRGNQAENKDALSQLTRSVLQGQSSAESKLEALSKTVQLLLKTQGDAAAVNHTVLARIKANEQQKMQLLGEMKAWVESGWKANKQRLEAIGTAVSNLQEQQKVRVDLVQQLQNMMNYTSQTLDSFYDDWKRKNLAEMSELLRQAEDKQQDREFDRAIERYERFLTKSDSYRDDPEIRWRIVMCHYGIEYKKNKRGKHVPTILRPDLTPPEDMSVRTNLLKYCKDSKVRAHYEKQLREIDELLDKYRTLRNERQYDIFISVKHKDGRGWRTPDSDRASTLFDQLTQWGYRVFNSERSAELQPIPAGAEWEPYVISALMSARVMIVVGTSAKHMSAEWVRDEWTRFQWLQRDEARRGIKERVLFCYLALGMTPEKLPDGLNPDIQAIVEDVNAGNKLKSTLDGIFGMRRNGGAVSGAIDSSDVEENNVLSQMRAWLANGQYEQVKEKYAELMADGKHLGGGWVHLYKLCADYQATDPYKLAETSIVLEEHPVFTLAEDTPGDHQKILKELLSINRAENRRRERERKKQQQEEARRRKEKEKAGIKRNQKKKQSVVEQFISMLIFVGLLIGVVYFADARGWVHVPWTRVERIDDWAKETDAGIKDILVECLDIVVDTLDGEGDRSSGSKVNLFDFNTSSQTKQGSGKISSISAIMGETELMLRWNLYDGASRYRVYYRGNKSDPWQTIANVTTNSITTAFFYSGYNHYYIEALDSQGKQLAISDTATYYKENSSASGKTTAQTASVQAQQNIGTVKGLQAVASGADVVLQWDSYAGAYRYSVYYRKRETDAWETIVETYNTNITTSKFYSGFNYYYVKAYDTWGNLLAQSESKMYYKAAASNSPATPKTVRRVENLICSQHGTGVSLKWTALSGATRYDVYIGMSVDGPWKLVSSTEKVAIKTHYCYNDTRNYFFVEAYDSSGNLIGKSLIENCYILV